MSRFRNRARIHFNAVAGAVLRATGPKMRLGSGGYVTILHDYEGEYAMPGMAAASHRGVTRMLELERRYGLRTTYNIVGRLAEDLPQVVETIIADGHEVAGHTYDHRFMTAVSAADMREDLEKTIDGLMKFGVRIRGMRAPKGRWDFRLLKVMADCGLQWSAEGDSATMPYYILPGRLLRFPVKIGDHMQYSRFGNPQAVLKNYFAVVDRIAAEGTFGALAFHPWVQAQSEERLGAYERLLQRIVSTPGITVLPLADLAERLGMAAAGRSSAA